MKGIKFKKKTCNKGTDYYLRDHEICERLEEGRSSPASKHGGLLSPHWEKSVQAFHKLVLNGTFEFQLIQSIFELIHLTN